MREKLRVELFDGLRIVGGRSAHPPAEDPARRNLLAYLCYFRHPHSRDSLVARCWPHLAPSAGQQALRAATFWLQDVLQTPFDNEPAILVEPASLGFNARAVATDVAEFHAALDAAALTRGQMRLNLLRGALDLYAGPLLTGFYEPWVAIEERRMEDLYVATVQSVAEQHYREGEPSGAAACLQRAIALHPTRRDLCNDLIRLHAAAGHAAAARSLFENSIRLQTAMQHG